MKHFFWLPIFLALSCFAAGCGKDDGSSCSKNATITAVQPNTNPLGYEVLLKTSGFTSAAKVVFGSVAAASRAGGEAGDIIAKVPAGVVGNVEIAVEEGDCLARSSGFTASGALPTGVQPSLPTIIVPTATVPSPNNIPNFWRNAAQESTGISLQGAVQGGILQLDANSMEFDFNNASVENNKVTGTININTNVIYLEVDRTPNGGSVERFDGKFIAVPDFLLLVAEKTILLVSRETGRQLLIYYII